MMMMMMMNSEAPRSHPIVHVPPWNLLDDPTANMASRAIPVDLNSTATSPTGDTTNHSSPKDGLTALHRYLPSNSDSDFQSEEYGIPVDASACDYFRMFEFKVRKCARARSHDWTECPYAHAGEKARRRDPRRYNYSGEPCPEFRKGHCKSGESCEFAHGVFECWLHPTRYRTQPCKDGANCPRRVCFFAHTPDQLRVLPQISDSYDRSPSRLGFDSFGSSPNSTLYSPSDSPPMSPSGSLGVNSVSELASVMRNLQLGGMRMSMSPPSWGIRMGSRSPRSPTTVRPGFLSLPSTPTRTLTRSGLGAFDLWDQTRIEEPVMERVESGRDLRAKIYGKLSKENSLDRVDPVSPCPDLGWVSELVK
ncbi:zinc finger C-x8-C-x5-C-x3-H type family protein [Actinidia rufa]|uniref:Zinc finger C-x8-C-x5-C-x3-H type family protein n=1 Tax=Actinidia rufa TaxID=165716 RepID=A0A7J0H1Q7_9ERIC|nr:zinc finger C-x8-C-x5-C-x3-H type family protein [Actinidia rufa]